ncbi:PAS domain-containing protein [Cognatiyoonia koreensis]|uniref:PAS domain-containing protein n=1 Tax=Cognatiyoonia koreensis TaxID=364200 RepID=A0A1I0P593_9RHOB|nr:PAS domain-containing protein [Cognatiyoonia koreensis]SEW09219.1 PAS domain-containing protein [Cognatiyoonia koreensis]
MGPILRNSHNQGDTILDQAGQDILRSVEQNWRRMCGNELTPLRHRLDPMQMDLALPYTFMLHVTEPCSARVRVAGQKLHEMLRSDPRGQSFAIFFASRAQDTIMELIDATLALPAIVRIPLSAPQGFGRKAVRAECLLLPMRDAEGALSRIIGVIVPEKVLKPKAHKWEIDQNRDLLCDIQEGYFPDRRGGQRSKTLDGHETTQPNIRLVVDNTSYDDQAEPAISQ